MHLELSGRRLVVIILVGLMAVAALDQDQISARAPVMDPSFGMGIFKGVLLRKE